MRELGPTSRARLGTFLWHAARTRAARSGKEHRAAASAGGLHPIETVLVGDDNVPELYDPRRHALYALRADAVVLGEAVQECRAVIPSARGVLLLFGAHAARTGAAYANPESLHWRDAGCVLATFHLVATWLGLGFCPLGVLGAKVWSAIDPLGEITPAGAAMLGEPDEAATACRTNQRAE